MILSDKKILEEIKNNNIVIDPFSRENLGSNRYDVHLGKWLAVYESGKSKVEVPYNLKKSSKYNERTEYPVESMMFKNFI